MLQRLISLASVLTLTGLSLSAQDVRPSPSGTNALLQAVSPVSAQVVWVSGHQGTVLRSTDGGASWERRIVPGADSLQFRDIHALSADEAWAMSAGPGSQSRIYHTTDGGAGWTLQFTNADSAAFYDCLTMFDRRTGVAFSDASGGRTNILRTTDGGAHWQLLPAEALPVPLEGEGAFAASGGCLTSIDARHGWVALGGPGSRFLRTDDAGATWTLSTTPVVHGASAGNAAAAFRDARHGMVVGGDMGSYTRDTSAAAVAITSDGGATWTLRARPPHAGTPFGVAMVPAAGPDAAVVASPGGLSVTRDGGQTWTVVDQRAFWSVGVYGKSAWAVGPRGLILVLAF